ncbi:MAG: DUF5916 domain-containing protein [bacterium]
MKKILLIVLLPTLLFAANDIKKLIVKKIASSITIDGKLDDIWMQADSVSDFVQYQPYHNTPPTIATVAKVLTTEETLYCLMVCYDKYVNIQKFTGRLDNSNGDIVSLMIDTFDDKQSAYKFAVSASGVRSDCRLLDDARNRDYNWDGIWFADSKIYDWGFVIEMEIPYKSIKYDKTLTEWGLDFDRWRPINSEDIYWCAYDKAEGQRISKFGRLVFDNFQPTVEGLNLEIFPVAIAKATYLHDGKYKIDPNAGLDIFYNPSQQLTFQLTANPDFAQIEADPYDFNISRYESYFGERRPFFVEGAEVFAPSGKQRNTGFYSPMELFYSRRIGKKLPDGNEVPLSFGTRAFGRMDDWEYGGFIARTEETEYTIDNEKHLEPMAYFASARVKKQIFGNSSLGILFVGKHTEDNDYGVLDIDGALRESNWQLAYQFARSIKNSEGDYAASFGFTQFTNSWMNLIRGRYVGEKFDISEVGYVPWRGTATFVGISGPAWYPETGYVSQILIYGGGAVTYEKADEFTDYSLVFGYNMQFRDNWGFEINLDAGKAKDLDIKYNSYSVNLSSWFNVHPSWNLNVYGGYQNTYNFSRDYLAFYAWMGSYFSWNPLSIMELGTEYNMWIEGNPDGAVEDITYNTRPFISLNPVNDLNLRLYVDNVFVKSTDKMEQVILGFLFSYNFLPKSWIYFAINEIRDRRETRDELGNILPNELRLQNRVSVLKISYLYYF